MLYGLLHFSVTVVDEQDLALARFKKYALKCQKQVLISVSMLREEGHCPLGEHRKR